MTTRFYKAALIVSVLVNVLLAAWIAYYPSFAEVSSIVDLAVGLFN